MNLSQEHCTQGKTSDFQGENQEKLYLLRDYKKFNADDFKTELRQNLATSSRN